MSDDHRHALEQIMREEQKAYPGQPEDRFFELFSAEQVLKSRRFALSPDQLRGANTGGSNDGGVDTFFVFANRRLVEEDTDLSLIPGDALKIEVIVVQSTRRQGFREAGIVKFSDFARYCLRLTADHKEASPLFNSALLEAVDRFRNLYRANLHKKPELTIRFFYATLADNHLDPKVGIRKDRLLADCDEFFSGAECDVEFFGAEQILRSFNKKLETTIQLSLKKSLRSKFQGDAYVGLVSLKDFHDFITEDGTLREHLFESNVRDYQGPVTVNKFIHATLDQPAPGQDFWWLNNGVTILASDLGGDSELLSVTDPLIVNGLQTSFVIHEHFSKSTARSDDERMLLVRIIKATDPTVVDAIIKATNSQTAIPPSWLHATEEVHRNIEIVFKGYGLYYERRKNFHKRRGVAASRIVSLPYLAQAVAAIVLQRPDDARARPTSVVTAHYRQLFSKSAPIEMYVKCAQAMKRVEEFLDGLSIDRSRQNNLRFYVAMTACARVLRSASPRRDRVARLDVAAFTDDFLQHVYDEVNALYEAAGGNDRAAKGPAVLSGLRARLDTDFPKRTITEKTRSTDASENIGTSLFDETNAPE